MLIVRHWMAICSMSLGDDAGLSADSASPDARLEDDPTAPLLDPEYVMDEVVLLPAESGFDLDDGTPDNALALLFSDPLGVRPSAVIRMSLSPVSRRGELLLSSIFINSAITE